MALALPTTGFPQTRKNPSVGETQLLSKVLDICKCKNNNTIK